MRDTLSQSASAFFRRPILILPTLVAATLAFWLKRLQSFLAIKIIYAMLPKQSVLDPAPDLTKLGATSAHALPIDIPLAVPTR